MKMTLRTGRLHTYNLSPKTREVVDRREWWDAQVEIDFRHYVNAGTPEAEELPVDEPNAHEFFKRYIKDRRSGMERFIRSADKHGEYITITHHVGYEVGKPFGDLPFDWSERLVSLDVRETWRERMLETCRNEKN
jgi:hypothetical protein